MLGRIGLVGAIAVLASGVLAPAAMAGEEKVTICHKPGTPAEDALEVAASAVGEHLAHGDYAGECGSTPAPKVLALAFTDLDGDHVFGGGDVLIAKLVDTNGDEVLSAGDTIRLGRYPTNLTPGPADFADWNVTSHVVTGIVPHPAVWVEVATAAGSHHWFDDGDDESYWEEASPSPAEGAFFRDYAGPSGYPDVVHVQLGSPSEPATAIPAVELARPSDDALIDVVLDL
jgi:hypothetical protein